MIYGFYGRMRHLQEQGKASSDGVSAQVEAQGRQGLPRPRRGLPQGRQGEAQDGGVAGLPRRAPKDLRRPHRALQAGVRGGQRRGQGRAAGRADHDPPPAEDRQARGRAQERGVRRPAGRLRRLRRRDRHQERDQGLQGRLRRQRRHEVADRRAHHRPRLQEGRLGEQGAPLLQVRVLARGHLPRPRRAVRLQGQGRLGHQPLGRQDGHTRHGLRVLRRHQLLLRGRRRRRRGGA